jgi:hypothetical protein
LPRRDSAEAAYAVAENATCILASGVLGKTASALDQDILEIQVYF